MRVSMTVFYTVDVYRSICKELLCNPFAMQPLQKQTQYPMAHSCFEQYSRQSPDHAITPEPRQLVYLDNNNSS